MRVTNRSSEATTILRDWLAPVLISLVGACAPADESSEAGPEEDAPEGVVEVVTRGLTLEAPAEVPSGWTTFRFVNESPWVHFVGHDVHLARVGPDTDLDALEAWMDWSRPAGLDTPAPVEFIGGLNEMPAGSTGYFGVTLDPGSYVWISEVPGTREKGMLRRFTVPGGG